MTMESWLIYRLFSDENLHLFIGISKWDPNKLRWYPQQPQRFIFTNLSEACCEAKRCKYRSWVCTQASQTFSGTFSGTLLNLTWLCTKASQTFSGKAPADPTFSGTFSGTVLNLTWLCTKAPQTATGTFSGTLLNLTWLCTKASQTFIAGT